MHHHESTLSILEFLPVIILGIFFIGILLKKRTFPVFLSIILFLFTIVHVFPVQHVFANHHGGESSNHLCCMPQITTLPDAVLAPTVQIRYQPIVSIHYNTVASRVLTLAPSRAPPAFKS